MKIKKLNPSIPTPVYAKPGDAGLDLCVSSGCPVIIVPNEVFPVNTGVAVEIPDGHVGLLLPRSSLAKKNLMLANTVGVIDSGYRGEIIAKIRSFSSDNEVLVPHERFSQLIVVPFKQVEVEVVEELSETERGAGGFGSTGS